ncbi:hypothetical protein CR152_21665 [Massilia violaceinigra]|uniref:Uncharacterized protein n=1 Tax=Massilia violaceinigra TaxID=2045208 RepID=A0A2D2DPC8_9BURK|nr:hypothetical protein CR152_21665 [Massilia violaceinigra]
MPTFENNGLLYGALLGALAGVLIAGPRFTDWSIQKILAAIAVSSAVIGMTGRLAVWIAYTAISAGPTPNYANEQDDSSPDGAHASDD